MADGSTRGPRFCSQCGRPVTVLDALYCKECGADLGPGALNLSSPTLIAAILSILPGLGHFYAGRTRRAIGWCFAVLFSYATAASLGLLIHIICAVSAARLAREEVSGRRSRGTHPFATAPRA